MTFGERLRELRKKNGLSQEQLAEILKVSRQAVQKWETDSNDPSIESIKSIIDYFKVDYNYLFGSIEYKNNSDDKVIKKRKKDNDKNIVWYICLGFFLLLVLILFIWTLFEPGTYHYGNPFYRWYIPFVDDTIDVIIFQVLNLLALTGIIVSIRKIYKNARIK